MDENNNLKLNKIEEQTQTIQIHSHRNKSLINKTYFQKDVLDNSSQNDIKSKKNENFEQNLSLLNILSNKSHFVNPQDFKIISEIPEKGKTCSFTMRKLIPSKPKNKKVIFNFIPKKKDFYLTSAANPIIKRTELKKCNSTLNLNSNEYRGNFLIDLIHEKEIQLCLDLIKTLPENKNIKNKHKGNNLEFQTEETDNLIHLLKTFNIDNINSQRRIEAQILNNTLFNSELNPLNTFSLSMSTNYNTNNFTLNKIYKFNASNYTNNKNFNSSSISLKNSSIMKNNNDSNILNNFNNNSININSSPHRNNGSHAKTTKSINNKGNHSNSFYSKMIYDPRNEINFHTGFVRSQKKIYEDAYAKFFNNKKNEIRAKNYRKKKKEKNKLSLPEIEEYKSIIKDLETRNNKALRKSKSALNINMEKGEFVLKDQLIGELNNIYEEQKKTFLNSLKDNFGDNEKMVVDLHKKEINENIRNINKVKRKQNSFVDGYSLFDGKTNKILKEYNYILGNRFHDKEQKEEKAVKLHEIYEELENKINSYKNELLNEKNKYKQIFIPKIDFKKDNYKNLDDEKFNKNYYKNYVINGNTILGSINEKIKLPAKYSRNNKKEKIYNDYINFKNQFNKKYIND